MLTNMVNFVQTPVEFSMLGCVEIASVVLIVYYIYAKTRALAIIASLFPNLNSNISDRSPLVIFNNMGNELLISLRNGTKWETKPQNTLAHGIGTKNMLEITPHAGRKPYNSSFFDWGVYFPFIAQSLRSKKFQYPQVSGLVEKDPVLKRAIKQAAEEIILEKKLANKRATTNNDEIGEDVDVETEAEQQPEEIEEIKQDDEPKIITGSKKPTLRAAEMEYADYSDILNRQEKRAMSVLKDMASTLNNFLLSLTSWILYKLLPCFLTGVVTHTQQIEMLKTASKRAPGIPLIFLPLHRSHLDYIMVTFILTNNDIRSPLVAAGNNLQIPVFGKLLRGLGAFFIKRKIDPIVGKKDIVYRAVLHLYLQHALKMGHNVEFFIEGGRTRTGKPCMPKGGILSVIVNAFMDGSIPDALLVPVSVNYERLVDGNFVREQKGEKKVPESFRKAMSGIWKALNSKYGLMRIDFNEPYSIRELVQSYNKVAKDDGNMKVYKPAAKTLQHNQSTSSLYGTDVICEEHRNLIDSISRQVVYDCAAATSVMSTNALAFLLLTRFRDGAPEKEIAEGLDELRTLLNGRKDIGFSGDSLHVIKYACELLGRELILRTTNEQGHAIIRPVPTVECIIELSYYSNMLTPHFALQSILLTTFHALLPHPTEDVHVNKDNTDLPGVARKKLIELTLENCDVYRYEFILSKPTQVLESLLEITLDELIIQNFITLAQSTEEPIDSVLESRKIARNIAAYLDDGDDEYNGGDYVDSGDDHDDNAEQIEQPNLFLVLDSVKEQKIICEVLAPISHTYLAVAQSLDILYKNSMLETEFVKFVMTSLSNKVKTKTCPYAESISTDSVRNCMKLLEKWSVIEICNQHGLRLTSLRIPYETSKDSLKQIVQRIAAIVPNYKNGYF